MTVNQWIENQQIRDKAKVDYSCLPVKRNELQGFEFCMQMLADDASHMKSAEEVMAHPAYVEISKMGDKVLNMIFKEISHGHEHWCTTFLCLRENAFAPPQCAAYAIVMGQALNSWTQRATKKPGPTRKYVSL